MKKSLWLLLGALVFMGCEDTQKEEKVRVITYTFEDFPGFFETEAAARNETRDTHLVDSRNDMIIRGYNDKYLRLELHIQDNDRNSLSSVCTNNSMRINAIDPDMKADTVYRIRLSEYNEQFCDGKPQRTTFLYFKTKP